MCCFVIKNDKCEKCCDCVNSICNKCMNKEYCEWIDCSLMCSKCDKIVFSFCCDCAKEGNNESYYINCCPDDILNV